MKRTSDENLIVKLLAEPSQAEPAPPLVIAAERLADAMEDAAAAKRRERQADDSGESAARLRGLAAIWRDIATVLPCIAVES